MKQVCRPLVRPFRKKADRYAHDSALVQRFVVPVQQYNLDKLADRGFSRSNASHYLVRILAIGWIADAHKLGAGTNRVSALLVRCPSF